MGRVDGKIAIVTGGAMGIGRATCELLAKEGAKVAITDVADEEGQRVADEINQAGGEAAFWHMDVSDEAQVEAVIGKIHDRFGRIDILVNNAGISGIDKPTHEISAEEWNKVIAIDLNGVFFCTKHTIPHMLEQSSGSIVNLSSIYGIISAPDAPPYHAAKGAVRLMTKTDALIYAKDGIRVNSVHPGFVWTPMVENYARRLGSVEEVREHLLALHPIGRLGEPEDVAYMILFLASDESSFVTGSEFVIDGGYTAR